MTIYTPAHTEKVALPEMSMFDYLFDHPNSPLPHYDPNLPAYIDGLTGRQITRGETKTLALRLAAGLRKLGMKKGDTATIWSLNSIPWIITGHALSAAGITSSPANYAYESHEIAHQLNNAGSTMLFVTPENIEKFERTRPQLKYSFPDSRVIILCELKDKPPGTPYKALEEIFAAEPGHIEHLDGAEAHLTGWLCYSSGTTGLPKGVMTTHWNLVSQLQAVRVGYEPLGPGDHMLAFVPLSHTYGTTMVLHQPFSVGCTVVLLPRFEEVAALKCIEKYKVVHGLIVPPIVITLLHSPHVPKYDLRSLRTLMCAAAPLGPDLTAAIEARLACKITQGYGLTETSPLITCYTGAEAEGRSGWVGPLLPTWEARLVDEDGNDVKGDRGELWVRGPSVMKGYHNNVAATEKTTAPGGWFKTGDIMVRSEDGWLKVVDRSKELIKYKGFQVPPAELEELLLKHPLVKDTAVVGIYDHSQATELPTAFITVGPEAGATDEASSKKVTDEVAEWVGGKIANHKRLRGGVFIVDAVPKSPSGKILRRLLRDKAQAERDALTPPKYQAKL